MTDIIVSCDGNVCLFKPVSVKGHVWIVNNIGLVKEYSVQQEYKTELVHQLRLEGLSIED